MKNYNPNLQNLIFPEPNEVIDSGKGVAKSKGVVMGSSKSGGGGILDTFSLSFVGNLNFSNAVQGVQKIVEGLASCELPINVHQSLLLHDYYYIPPLLSNFLLVRTLTAARSIN